jgi:hypothetical protein
MFDPSDRFRTDPFVRYHAAMRTSEERAARAHKPKVGQLGKGSNACETRRRSGRLWRVPIHAISQFFRVRLSTEAAEPPSAEGGVPSSSLLSWHCRRAMAELVILAHQRARHRWHEIRPDTRKAPGASGQTTTGHRRDRGTCHAFTNLSIRQIQIKIAGRASRGVVGEITKRARTTLPTAE